MNRRDAIVLRHHLFLYTKDHPGFFSDEGILKIRESGKGLIKFFFDFKTSGANCGLLSRIHDNSSVLGAWSRVTSTLVIIHLDGKYHNFSDAVDCHLLKRAEEQQTIEYSYFKLLYFYIQHPVALFTLYIIIFCITLLFMTNLKE